MNILLITPSYKPAFVYGGPAVSVSELAEALVTTGNTVTVYTTTANGIQELAVESGKPIVVNGVIVYYFQRQTGDHTHISFALWKKLWNTISNFDVVHIQSWWSILVLVAAAICRIKNCRYTISPRGMLSRYSFQHQHSLFKKIIHKVIGCRLLKSSYLHATTTLEWHDCLEVNPSWEGFVLPNLVRFPANLASKECHHNNDRIVFGFLSRIDKKKGLELFFEALSRVTFDYRFKIAGTGEEDYISSLKQLAGRVGISSKIDWCGWKSGEEKFNFLVSIDVLVLTSYNENFANVVIESLAVGTPVLISNRVGLYDYILEHRLGFVCELTSGSIISSLNRIWGNKLSLELIRKQSPALIEKDFDKNPLAERYAEAYKNNR